MARFRLTAPHYLNVPGTQWEQTEYSAASKKQVRHLYNVHLLLDPNDPSMHNYPLTQEIIVATKVDRRYPADMIFVGSPTQDMEPLDEEAEALLRRLPLVVPPMSEAALPTSGPMPVAKVEQSEFAQFMAQMQGQMALLIGQNEALARKVAELEAERDEPEFIDAPIPEPAQPEVRI